MESEGKPAPRGGQNAEVMKELCRSHREERALSLLDLIEKGTIDIDLAFRQFSTPIPLAFTIAFALGWLFGVLSIGFYVLKLLNERRALRRSLRMSESEVTSLRNLPLSDAD